MTRADGEADGAPSRGGARHQEDACSACSWLLGFFKCFSGAQEERHPQRATAEPRYLAPTQLAPLRTVTEGSEASATASAEETSTLLPKRGELSSIRLARPVATTHALDHTANAGHGEPPCPHGGSAPLHRMSAQHAPLVVIGTPVAAAAAAQCPAQFHDLAVAAAAMRSSRSVMVSAAAPARQQHQSRHRRTQSSGEYLVFRTSSHTSQGATAVPTLQLHCAGRHSKRPSLAQQEFGKGFLPDLPCSVNTKAAIFAAAAAVGASAEEFDDDSHFCPTCLELYTNDNPKLVTACGHHFHLPCLYAWLERKDTCPMCDTTLVFEGLA